MKPKPTCKFCGSKMILHSHDLALMEFACGTGIATEVCHGILWSENQSMECLKSERTRLAARVAELEDRCKRLEEAGDALQSAVVGTEGMTHWQWLAAAHEADLRWRKAKEAKP